MSASAARSSCAKSLCVRRPGQLSDDLLLFVQSRVIIVDLLDLTSQRLDLRLKHRLFTAAIFEIGNLPFDGGNEEIARTIRSHYSYLRINGLQSLMRCSFIISF
jgi:hypothetical protein